MLPGLAGGREGPHPSWPPHLQCNGKARLCRSPPPKAPGHGWCSQAKAWYRTLIPERVDGTSRFGTNLHARASFGHEFQACTQQDTWSQWRGGAGLGLLLARVPAVAARLPAVAAVMDMLAWSTPKESRSYSQNRCRPGRTKCSRNRRILRSLCPRGGFDGLFF